jgi:hypothetical protein
VSKFIAAKNGPDKNHRMESRPTTMRRSRSSPIHAQTRIVLDRLRLSPIRGAEREQCWGCSEFEIVRTTVVARLHFRERTGQNQCRMPGRHGARHPIT